MNMKFNLKKRLLFSVEFKLLILISPLILLYMPYLILQVNDIKTFFHVYLYLSLA